MLRFLAARPPSLGASVPREGEPPTPNGGACEPQRVARATIGEIYKPAAMGVDREEARALNLGPQVTAASGLQTRCLALQKDDRKWHMTST